MAEQTPLTGLPVADVPGADLPAAELSTADAGRRGPTARALLAVLNVYRTGISPIRPASCRYVPSCSAYAAEAVELHGAARGSWLALASAAALPPVCTSAGTTRCRPAFTARRQLASDAATQTSFRPAA